MMAFFRIISVVEGLSFLMILSVSFDFLSRAFVFELGMTHGVLFALYLVLSLIVATKRSWSLVIWLPVFLASLVPFAFILVELYLRKVSVEGDSDDES